VHIDKWIHGLAFFGLSALAQLAGFKPRTWLIALLLYGIAIELVQSTIPYRSASIADIGADLTGITLYFLLAKTPLIRSINRWLTGAS
jgi:VanZ family protein